MAKRKKARRRRTRAQKARRRPPPAVVATTAAAVREESRQQQLTVDFKSEYAYVYQDLKRIAILAGSILVILIALSFVIR
ncbi:MAG: hypothetical protein ACE5NP_05655 [Anaerolineae bacterium]